MFTSSDSGLPKNIVVTDNGAIRYYWRRGFQAFFMTLFGVMLLWAAYYFWSPDFVPEFLICSLPLFWIPGVVLAYFGVRQADLPLLNGVIHDFDLNRLFGQRRTHIGHGAGAGRIGLGLGKGARSQADELGLTGVSRDRRKKG